MPTESLHDAASGIGSGAFVGPVQRPLSRPTGPVVPPAGALDVVSALAELSDAPGDLGGNGLADALLAWVMPRPRNPASLSQPRIAPLLGVAITMLQKGGDTNPDIARLGADALEQELQSQRALAERRAAVAAAAAQ